MTGQWIPGSVLFDDGCPHDLAHAHRLLEWALRLMEAQRTLRVEFGVRHDSAGYIGVFDLPGVLTIYNARSGERLVMSRTGAPYEVLYAVCKRQQ